MKNLILIKLGGSVITDKSKPFTPRIANIDRLIRGIKKNYISPKNDLIVAHGAGSFGHVPASKYQTAKGNFAKDSVWGLCLTADAAIKLNRIVMERFINQKIPAISFAPLSFTYNSKINVSHIKKALQIGAVAVTYGDVIMDDSQDFHINSGEITLDNIAAALFKNYKKVTVVYYTDTNGVYDDNKKTIPLITPKNFKDIKKFLVGSSNTDVTGGMIHKVEESLKIASKLGADIIVTNGLKKGKSTLIKG